MPLSIRRALAIPAATVTGTLQDVRHVVILMQENRSFDHYFGTLRGVRGFGDPHPVPLASGKPVWNQSDGAREIPPFHLDTATTSALRVPSTPHSFSNAQAAWNQGRFGFWPKYKTGYSMGYYQRGDIPFQFALAEAFTLCDAYHCSVTTGTDPNRIVFFSGCNFDPEFRTRGVNCTDAQAEVNNLRCWIEGTLPQPGYRYKGSAFAWPTLPELLQDAGISWRIYQDPNNNWTGLMHGGLAFKNFRTAQPGSPLYEQGMRHWSLEQLTADARAGVLPAVSWVLPPQGWSEHPSPSSPVQGAEFTARVLDALTANPQVWSKTVFFLCFDENDGLFDHVPPPAPPSYNLDGTLAGAATLDLRGHYFSDPERKFLDASDVVSGTLRPWGLGPRVPMYVISPWSRGGWVCSQVFDHTSVGRFLERRFGIVIPAISPWHRAVCGDLTAAFDFSKPNDAAFPHLPSVRGSSAVVLEHIQRPMPAPPNVPERTQQEPGFRPSRALPYELHVDAREHGNGLQLTFRNTGRMGAVFHVYDRRRLERIPRRYTVEAGKVLGDICSPPGEPFELSVFGPNGFFRAFQGIPGNDVTVDLRYDPVGRAVHLLLRNATRTTRTVTVRANAQGSEDLQNDGSRVLQVRPGREARHLHSVIGNGHWYDLTVEMESSQWRFAGRMETGAPGISDPAMAVHRPAAPQA